MLGPENNLKTIDFSDPRCVGGVGGEPPHRPVNMTIVSVGVNISIY